MRHSTPDLPKPSALAEAYNALLATELAKLDLTQEAEATLGLRVDSDGNPHTRLYMAGEHPPANRGPGAEHRVMVLVKPSGKFIGLWQAVRALLKSAEEHRKLQEAV